MSDQLFDTAADPAEKETARLRKNIGRLLVNIADGDFCTGCRRQIFWVIHKNGVRTPYNPDGVNHFVTCEKREQFKVQAREMAGEK